MQSVHVLESQQSTVAPTAVRGRAGCWTLEVGRTLALHPRRRSVLTVVQGRVWLTQFGGQVLRGEDCFLGPGERWVAEPGRRVVLEPVGPGVVQAVAFRWEPLPSAAPAAAEWEGAVRQPLRDLARSGAEALHAARGVAGALARLGVGAVRWALRHGAWATGARRSA